MPFLVYSLLRLALFGACWLALTWAGLHPLVAVVAAALAAWGLSYVALRGPRDAAARWLAEKDAARKAALAQPDGGRDADARAEDELLDAAENAAEDAAARGGGRGVARLAADGVGQQGAKNGAEEGTGSGPTAGSGPAAASPRPPRTSHPA